jgi:hypothetical protein
MSTQSSNQWFTPPEILDLIDHYFQLSHHALTWFDPTCSPNSLAASYADSYRSGLGGDDDDALGSESWPLGHLFMNPPYSNPQPFTERFVGEMSLPLPRGKTSAGDRAGVVLVNSATSTRWWQDLVLKADAVCFVSPRIRFLRERGPDDDKMETEFVALSGVELVRPSSPRYESCLVGFGNPNLFKTIFGKLGYTVKRTT